MNNKTLAIVLIVLVVVVGAFIGWYVMENDDADTTTNTNATTITQTNRERPPVNTVWIIDGNFSPSVITADIGETVTWVNKDELNRQVSSMATANANAGTIFESEELTTGESYSYTFDTAGTWSYSDKLNPIKSGQIVVE